MGLNPYSGANPYTGDVALALAGWPALTLRFDWAALAAVQAQFGGSDKVIALVVGNDIAALLELTAIGLARHHPEMTAERLSELPAQMAPLAETVGLALACAWNGPAALRAQADPPAGESRREGSGQNPPNRTARRAAASGKRKPARSSRR